MLKKIIVSYVTMLAITSAAYAGDNHSATMKHGDSMSSSAGMHSGNHSDINDGGGSSGLTEAGNDAFGTIQEVIVKLLNDPKTDWSKVNIEALRKHLLDMNDMTLNVDVVSQKPVKNGLQAIVKPTTARAAKALERVYKGHPPQLKRETGWEMVVKKNGEQYILTTTSSDSNDTNKIRGLGYIGLMAYGNHHQPHHLLMAVGGDPHAVHGSH